MSQHRLQAEEYGVTDKSMAEDASPPQTSACYEVCTHCPACIIFLNLATHCVMVEDTGQPIRLMIIHGRDALALKSRIPGLEATVLLKLFKPLQIQIFGIDSNNTCSNLIVLGKRLKYIMPRSDRPSNCYIRLSAASDTHLRIHAHGGSRDARYV